MLVKFELRNHRTTYINPMNVTSIIESTESETAIYLNDSDDAPVTVLGKIDEVALQIDNVLKGL